LKKDSKMSAQFPTLSNRMDRAVRGVAMVYDLDPAVMVPTEKRKGTARVGRNVPINDARAVAWLAMHQASFSYPDIGRRFNRDHGTVMSGVRRVRAKHEAGDPLVVEALAIAQAAMAGE
jgi:chromosomal replication initiation ATPase DnaA